MLYISIIDLFIHYFSSDSLSVVNIILAIIIEENEILKMSGGLKNVISDESVIFILVICKINNIAEKDIPLKL